LDIDAKVIGDVPLILNIEVAFHLTNCFVDFLFIRSSKDSIICVHNEDDVAVEEDALVDFGLFKANGLQSLDNILVPYLSCLLLAIEVFEEFEYMCLTIAVFCFYTHRQFHIHVKFDVCLGVCHNKVNLMGVPFVKNGEDKEESN
jgi:hypothetical protein